MIAVNSINFARIMAQIVYYFYSALRLGCSKNNAISFSVPSGNFGDIYAGFLAKRMGLNINKLIIATNSNDILVRFINNNDYSKKTMVETISPSMNIQIASNFERLLFDTHRVFKQEHKIAGMMQEFERTHKLNVGDDIHKKIQQDFIAYCVDDSHTKKAIFDFYQETGEILDPHTAIGAIASQKFMTSTEYQNEIVVTLATAHPAKFPDAITTSNVVKPSLPNFLKDLLDKKEKFTVIKNNLETVKNFITQNI